MGMIFCGKIVFLYGIVCDTSSERLTLFLSSLILYRVRGVSGGRIGAGALASLLN